MISLIVLRRILLIMGILYFYRAITMYITVLPPPLISYYCAPRENVTSVALYVKRAFHLMSGFGLSSNGKHVFCGDYFFSGENLNIWCKVNHVCCGDYFFSGENLNIWCKVNHVFCGDYFFSGENLKIWCKVNHVFSGDYFFYGENLNVWCEVNHVFCEDYSFLVRM